MDGIKIPCRSKNIKIAAVGKNKDGDFSKQISFSLLAHIPTGQTVGYECFTGDFADISLIDYYLDQWETIGIKDTDVTFAMDSGFFTKETVAKLYDKGIKFLIDMETSTKAATNVIEDLNYELYEPTSLLANANCYGIKTQWHLTMQDRTVDVDIFVYRNPIREMEESRKLKEKLLEFKKSWDEGKYDTGNNLLSLCNNPTEGTKLSIDWNAYNQECYRHRFFALASNIEGLTLENALDEYSMRNDAEVTLKLVFQHLLRTTKVHSLAELGGLLLAGFVTLNALGVLQVRMQSRLPERWRCKKPNATIKSRMGLSEMLDLFDGISLNRIGKGEPRLMGNTVKLKDLAGAIGMEGLFNSGRQVARLFSPSYLKQIIGTK